MAQYWVYLNNEVTGPFGVEQLIRLRGFSRQTTVCVDDASGKPSRWISVADIPELAHIFKAADEHQALPVHAAVSPKPSPARPAPKASGPAVVLKRLPRNPYGAWPAWLLAAGVAAAGFWGWSQMARRSARTRDLATAKVLVENASLPSGSRYATLGEYLRDKHVTPRWEFERIQDAVYRVTLSWYAPGGSSVYAFEANAQAQTLRAVNTAGVRLLSEGFAPPASVKTKSVPLKPKSPVEFFGQALDQRRLALEGGNFQAVWDSFSARQKTEMAKAGMSRDGYLRLQTLTYKAGSPPKQSVMKTRKESDTEMLVLIRQSQAGRQDMFIKQFWVHEHGEWKLDDEQKRAASTDVPRPASDLQKPAPTPDAAPRTPDPTALPGMSN